MAVVNQLNLNVGTEQNPNFVLHDINDKRISTTAVTTATHLLTCNSGVTSIAPITAANLASVLGAQNKLTPLIKISTSSALNTTGWCRVAEISPINAWYGSFLIHILARHNHRTPSPVVFLLSYTSTTHTFQQIGKRPKQSTYDITKVRVIQTGSGTTVKLYLDIYNTIASSGGNPVGTYIIPLVGVDNTLTAHTYEDVNNESTGTNYTEITPEANT